MPGPSPDNAAPLLSRDDINLLSLDCVQKLQASYEPGRDRVITPENVFQEARREGREHLEALVERLLLPGSALEGTEHLAHCLAELAAGRHVLFLSEHRGNLDVPTFAVLMRQCFPRAEEVQERLIYIAGRKLNESSDFIKMFSEKYARLVIVPRRDFPPEPAAQTGPDAEAYEAFAQGATRINRAAFRSLVRLKKAGRIFVLFPLGGRLKAGADNRPVPETISYLHSFDTIHLVSMEGNLLPPLERMEDERPVQERVVFRIGPPLDSKAFLAAERGRIEAEQHAGSLPPEAEFDQLAVEHIMVMLEHLRLHGTYGD